MFLPRAEHHVHVAEPYRPEVAVENVVSGTRADSEWRVADGTLEALGVD